MRKQVATRVTRQAQFGKNNDFYPFAIGNDNFFLYLRSIELAIGHLHTGYGRCHLYKSVVHIY